jgi:integrase
MPSQVKTTHVITDKELVVYRRNTSSVYQCRYKVGNKWQRATTHTADLKDAIAFAKKLHITAHVRKENNFVPIQRYFKDLAKLAIQRMLQNEAYGNGKVIYRNYIMIINKYLIKYFGKHYVDNITHNDIKDYADWRAEQLGRIPKRSTVIAHNVALNLIFEEAIQRGYLTEATKPKLSVDVKASDVRDAFVLDEVVAIRNNFDNWIAHSRQDSVAVRTLLKDYVNVLLDTGARPGVELLELTWKQIEVKVDKTITKTDKKVELENWESVDELVDEQLFRKEYAVILKIQKHKTKERNAVGSIYTYKAIERIAERNYGMTLNEVLKSSIDDKIFTYRELVTDRQKNPNRKAKLLTPKNYTNLFNEYLIEHNLLVSEITKRRRVLYSLRHTYATLALEHDKVPIHTLSRQMGTSVAMIEKHYSHLDAVKAMKQLRNTETRYLIDNAEAVSEKYQYVSKKKGANK